MIRYDNGDLEALEQIYDVYCDAFPEEERKSIEHLKALLSRGQYRLILMLDHTDWYKEDEIIVGFAMLYVSDVNQFSWLDYIVIDPKIQSKGYGSKLLLYLKETFKLLLFEVEIPDGMDSNRERRIKYYEKLGAIRLNWEYYLPTPTGGLKMFLYALGEEETYLDEGIKAKMHEALHYIHTDLSQLDEIINRSMPYEHTNFALKSIRPNARK